MSKDVSIVISFNTKPAADAMQSLLTVVNQAGGKVEELGEVPVPVPEGLPATKNTIAAIREEIRRLEEQLEDTDIGSAKFDDLSGKLAKAHIQLSNASNTQTRFAGSSMNARMMLQQFNFGLQDAPMFMMNFRAGLMSVGNNLDMVAQTFLRVREEAKETGKSVGSLVAGALKGPTGILIAVSALIALLQVLPALFKKSGDEADKAAEGGFKNFADRVREASRIKMAAALAEQISMIDKAQKELQDLQESIVVTVDKGPRAGMLERRTRGTPAEIATKKQEIDDMTAIRKILAEALGDREKEVGLESELQELTKQRDEILKGIGSKDQLSVEQRQKLVQLNGEIEAQEIRLKRLREMGTEAGKPPEVPKIEIEEPEDVLPEDFKGKVPRLQDRLAEIDALMKVEESDQRINELARERAQIQQQINDLTSVHQDLWKGTVDDMAETTKSQLAGEAASSFTRAWQRSFGEVNSAFEIMIVSMVNTMIERFTSALVSDILFTVLGMGSPGGVFKLFGLADGAIVTKPTLAVVGEAGTEAVVPLSKASMFLPAVPQPQNVNVNVEVSGQLRGEGMTLYGLIKRIERLERKYS